MKNVPNSKEIKREVKANDEVIEAQLVEENSVKEENSSVDELLYNMYLKMIEEEKNDIENKAKEIFMNEIGITSIGKVEEKIFEKTKKSMIIRAIKGDK